MLTILNKNKGRSVKQKQTKTRPRATKTWTIVRIVKLSEGIMPPPNTLVCRHYSTPSKYQLEAAWWCHYASFRLGQSTQLKEIKRKIEPLFNE